MYITDKIDKLNRLQFVELFPFLDTGFQINNGIAENQ